MIWHGNGRGQGPRCRLDRSGGLAWHPVVRRSHRERGLGTGRTSVLTLYFAPGSSSMAPHIALHEIGAPFESRPLSFVRKENRSTAYLALNPEGKVPTLDR